MSERRPRRGSDGRSPGPRRDRSDRGRPERRSSRSRGGPDQAPTLQAVAPSYDPVHLPDDVVKELRSTARPGKGDILVKVFADAAAAFAADDMDEAVRLAEQAKHIALRSAAARELLGLVHHRMGRWKEAARELAAFRRISGSTSQNPVLADAYRAMGRPDRALELCDEIDPSTEDPEVVYEGAIVAAGALADMDELDDAIARMMTLRLDPPTAEPHHMRAWYALADLLERRGRFTQAREYFEAVAAADPDLTDAPERAARLSSR